jgi:hypothetical protein
MTEAEREKIGSYEEAFEKIKEETGVNSMNVITITYIFFIDIIATNLIIFSNILNYQI